MSLVRLKKPPFPTRVESFNVRPSWVELASRITKIFDIPLGNVGVAYIDDDETSVITDELALLEYYESISDTFKIKFVVINVEERDTATTISASWSSKSNLSDLADGMLKLTCCAIGADPPRKFSATIRKDQTVDDFKKALKVIMGYEGSYYDLDVWKASPPVPSSDVAKLEHVESIEDASDFMELLDPFDRIEQHFLVPADNTIQIILQTPDPVTERPLKRRRTEEEGAADPRFVKLWEQTWRRNGEAVPWFSLAQTSGDHAIPLPEHYWVFSPPDDIAKALRLKPRSVLVRDDYIRALNRLFESSGWTDFVPKHPDPGVFYNPFSNAHAPNHYSIVGFILMGHPGIGKSTWLRILLVLRLCARLPTFYQISETRTLLFTEKGAIVIHLDSAALDCHMAEESTAWALVDSTLTVKIPPPEFMDNDIFVVHTPSPHSERLEWQNKYIGVEICCLSLWTLSEMICAAPLQPEHHEENSLIDFCNKYGLSARDAYSNASRPDQYEKKLQSYCNSLNYDAASDLVAKIHTLHFPDKVSHKVICIIPAENEVGYSFKFTSEHVYNRLLESLSKSEADAASMMYRKFLSMGETRSVSGFMLEPAMHRILGDGGTWEVIRLVKSEGPKNIHWKTPENPSVSWLHFTAHGISVDASNEDKLLTEGRPRSLTTGPLHHLAYYRPRSKTQATFDATVYDPVTNHAWILQSTVSLDHSVKVSGINDLRRRGITKITYIAVTPPGQAIDLPFPKSVDDLVVVKYQLQLV